MRRNCFLTLFFSMTASFLLACNSGTPTVFLGTPPSHDQWDKLLQTHVNQDGWVDYKGFIKDSVALNTYLDLLKKNHPSDSWSREEQLAYWINAYNAFTIQLVIRYYPVPSIKDIKRGIPFVSTVWDIKFIKIENQIYDLNNIEHSILRPKFKEPRIHFAVNCASKSCPKLLNRAFTAQNLNAQLDQVAKSFINDPTRNKIQKEKAELSSIFSWFKGDFTRELTLVQFLNKYSSTKIDDNAKISHLDYDWSLNEK